MNSETVAKIVAALLVGPVVLLISGGMFILAWKALAWLWIAL